MKIYIPTLARVDAQKTWDQLPKVLRARTYIVCPPEEERVHLSHGRQVLVCPLPPGISAKRQWLLERERGKFCSVDDDNTFFRRDPESKASWPFKPATESDLVLMFERIEKLLDIYPMVGVAGTSNSHALELRETSRGQIDNTRITNLYGMAANVFKNANIRFDVVACMQDMHVTLELLKRGYDVTLLTEFLWRQISGTKGGCAVYRTADVQRAAALQLAALHKPFVSVVKRNSKKSWKTVGAERIDVKVAWAKAASHGKQVTRKSLF